MVGGAFGLVSVGAFGFVSRRRGLLAGVRLLNQLWGLHRLWIVDWLRVG